MQNPVAIIHALEATNSRIDKEQILYRAFVDGERQFFTGAILAFDKLISFGVAAVPKNPEDDDERRDYSFNDFLDLTDALRRRLVTGHAARDRILDACADCDFHLWNDFFRRILLKDLLVGVKPSTINKVLTKLSPLYPDALKFIVPVFTPQLAIDGGDEKNHKHLRGEVFLDLKLDGVRLITELNCDTGIVTQYTRAGAVNSNFLHINEALAHIIPHLPGSLVIDGEVTAKSFQDLMGQLNRKNDSDTTTFKLAMFDLIPLVDFRDGYCKITQRERHEMLVALATSPFFQQHAGSCSYVLPKVEVNLDTEEGRAKLAEFRSATLAEKKSGIVVNEGVMVKVCEAPYENSWKESRPNHWIKLKPTVSASLTVSGVEKGKPDGKYANTLGSLLCEGQSDDGRQVKVNVNGGLSDAMRKEWWTDPSKIIGFIVEIEADEFTQAKNSDTWSMRFPRLKERRGTKPGEKI